MTTFVPFRDRREAGQRLAQTARAGDRRDQFDAVLHFDETCAVEPLERAALWEEGEVPETFPFAV